MYSKKRSINLYAAFGISSAVLIIIDRITKNWAKEHLMGQPSRSYLGGSFRLTYIENSGAFFGMGAEIPQPFNLILLSIIPLLLLIALLIYLFRNITKVSTVDIAAISLIFSGGLGNIIDRILYDTRVTDFMVMGIGSLRTGIFNVADMYVTAGVLVFLIFGNKWAKETN